VQEIQEVVGILSGGIDADDEVDSPLTLGDLFEALAELSVAGGRLGEAQFRCRRLQILTQEGGVVPIARGVDTDADTGRRGRRGRRECRRLRSGWVVW
jgi:hypothetical protein